MIILRADNRILTANAQYAYLTDNNASGVSTLTVNNTDPFAAEDFILVGEMGHAKTELFKITSVVEATGVITLKNSSDVATTTVHSHAESTKVTVLPYDQIRFYRTEALGTIADETPTFSDSDPLNSWTQIDPSSYYSVYEDTDNEDGFGWFEYKNTETSAISQNSNPILYAGFPDQTVLSIFNDFDSLLNVKELNLIKLADKFAWLNEGLSLITNKLNLTNAEYNVSSKQTQAITSGTSEYQLPSDFADMVEVVDVNSNRLDSIPVSQALNYPDGGTTVYYLRGRYFGIVPEPDTSTTVYYTYRLKPTRITSLSTYITLPDNAFYALKDWMLYRAFQKCGSRNGKDMWLIQPICCNYCPESLWN